MRTDALLLDEQLGLRLASRELAPPAAGEALVEVAWAGVCGSDLHVLRTGAWVAYWPATLGHEVVGVVRECPGGEVPLGTAVVVDSRVPCGSCRSCERAPSLCEEMAWLGEAMPGGFARHLVVPARRLVVCPDGLEPEVAVLAEPLAVAVHAVSRLGRAPDDVLLLGYGPIGALVHLELVRRWPALRVVVCEPAEGRRQLALALGATPLPEPPTGPPASGARSERFSLVVDAAGYPQSLARALDAAANGGTVLLVALSGAPVPVVPAEVVERTLTLVGSVGFDDELEEAVELLAADPDRYRPVVTEAVLLEEAAERLASLVSAPAAGKVVIRP